MDCREYVVVLVCGVIITLQPKLNDCGPPTACQCKFTATAASGTTPFRSMNFTDGTFTSALRLSAANSTPPSAPEQYIGSFAGGTTIIVNIVVGAGTAPSVFCCTDPSI